MTPAVREVNTEPDAQPHYKSDPGGPWEGYHQVQAGEHAEGWDNRHKGRPERTVQFRTSPAQQDDSAAHEHESKERADTAQIRRFADVHESCEHSDEDSGQDGRHVRCSEAGVDPGEYGRQQAVSRHGEEDPRLAELKNKEHGGRGHNRTKRDNPSRPVQLQITEGQ